MPQGVHTNRMSNRSMYNKNDRMVLDDEAMLFYEDFIKMQSAKRSKSLDQIHTIVLSDQILGCEQKKSANF